MIDKEYYGQLIYEFTSFNKLILNETDEKNN